MWPRKGHHGGEGPHWAVVLINKKKKKKKIRNYRFTKMLMHIFLLLEQKQMSPLPVNHYVLIVGSIRVLCKFFTRIEIKLLISKSKLIIRTQIRTQYSGGQLYVNKREITVSVSQSFIIILRFHYSLDVI